MYQPINWPTWRDAELAGHYRASGAWGGRTIADDARDWAEREPDATVFLGETRPATYSVLYADAQALAVSLWDLGIRPGDVVSFQIPNWVEAAVLNIACALIGAVINPVVPIYRDAEVGLMLEDCHSRVLFLPDVFRRYDFAAMIQRLKPSLPNLEHIVLVRAKADGVLDYESLVAAGRGRSIDWPKVNPEAVKMIMYTSGTTGRPKGVLHSHDTLARACSIALKNWRLPPGSVFLMPSPVTHVSGYSNGLELPFLGGTRTVLMESWNAAESVGLIDQHGVNATVGATPFLQELTAAAKAAGSRLPSLRIFACGGAAVPPDVIRDANSTFANPCAFRVYGSSEAPIIAIGVGTPDALEQAATTDGRVFDYDVQVLDDNGAPVAPGVDGEIVARGPSLYMGYADKKQTDDSFTPDGYFRTGDIGYVTEDHWLVITGRKKDLIIRGGENISAKEIEDVLHQHPAVEEASVVAMPHERLGEGICAYVMLRKDSTTDFAGLIAFMGGSGLAKQKYPEHVEFVIELPRTASGKIKKDILRKMIAEKLNGQA